MCGIAGLVNPAGGVTAETVTRMRETLRHRGPDDAGTWVSSDATAGLGHRRLSILDLSRAAHQPMGDPDAAVWMVYNGEVYNFRALRRELRGLGHRFASDGDTEVVLRAVLAWGIEAVERLEGMFALAVHDAGRGVTYLVRDRLGVKPLFYAVVDGRLVFGSEIRAVLASGAVPRELSAPAAYDFLTYGYVPTPRTIYAHVRKLPPATILTFSADGVRERTYWEPTFEGPAADADRAAERLRELVDRAVADELVADVPTGTYLSGGLDSSIVTQQAARVFARPRGPDDRLGGTALRTFSIGFDVAEHSELHYARAAAAAYGTVHAEQVVTAAMARAVDETVVGLFDEPFAASSTIPMLFVARLARREVTVALCGEGGDEAFGGYSWYRWWQRFRRPSFWRTRCGRAVRRLLETARGRPKRKWRLPAMEDVALYAQLMGAMSAEQKRRVFRDDVLAAMAGRDEAAHFRRHWRQDLPPMARMQYVDLKTFLPDLNLTRADRTSMHASLELRVPLLNHRLVDFACGLPAAVRNPGGKLKGLYKRAMGPRLPPAIRARKKKGFSAPVGRWLRGADLEALARAVLWERPAAARDWLRADLDRTVGRLAGSRAYKVWVLLQWLRRNG
jgi:asparagine synthase (glutamine-hydrolysing)